MMSELSPDELEQIRARCDRATRGPWTAFVEGRDHESGSSFIMVGEGKARGDDLEISGATTDDYDFIAHARQDVPRLLQEIDRLRGARDAQAAIKRDVELALSEDEALVLLDWLVRFNAEQHSFADQAEQRVLWDLEALLEKAVPAILSKDYAMLLSEARTRVRDPQP